LYTSSNGGETFDLINFLLTDSIIILSIHQVSEGSALGVQASSIMKEGGMVPTALILDLLIAAMVSAPAGSSFLVDGFPRKLDQLHEFEAKV
jgi:adenylate kinase family enzyme